MSQTPVIRLSKTDDLVSIVAIYNQAIHSKKATGDTEEFTTEQRLSWFRQFDAETYPLYVAELHNIVVGYCSISPYRKGRKAMEKVAEISYYVDYAYHKMGIASALVSFAISDCSRIGKNYLLAILLGTNKPSIALLEKFNFKQWGLFPKIVSLNGKQIDQVIYGLEINKS